PLQPLLTRLDGGEPEAQAAAGEIPKSEKGLMTHWMTPPLWAFRIRLQEWLDTPNRSPDPPRSHSKLRRVPVLDMGDLDSEIKRRDAVQAAERLDRTLQFVVDREDDGVRWLLLGQELEHWDRPEAAMACMKVGLQRSTVDRPASWTFAIWKLF